MNLRNQQISFSCFDGKTYIIADKFDRLTLGA